MIDEMLAAKKISPIEFKIYKLFSSELGHECLKDMIEQSFWEEVNPDHCTGESFAFVEGRRSVLRAIKCTVEHVQNEITKQLTPEAASDGI